MKKQQWLILAVFVFSFTLNVGFANDDGAKLERVEITVLDVEAMTLGVADMNFWVDAKFRGNGHPAVSTSFCI